MKVHAHNPFLATPFLLGNSAPTHLENFSLLSWKSLLCALCCGANPCPPLALVSCILNPPHPLHSPFPLPTVPLVKKACPLRTTLQHRLCIVRYTPLVMSSSPVHTFVDFPWNRLTMPSVSALEARAGTPASPPPWPPSHHGYFLHRYSTFCSSASLLLAPGWPCSPTSSPPSSPHPASLH
jgi:hypothetical protein